MGSGGREHAIAWKIRQSRLVDKVFVAPGNGGTAEFNIPIKADDVKALFEFAKEHHCLTVVGPKDLSLRESWIIFRSMDFQSLGPSRDEAMLETSKSYAKEFMRSHGIPTAKFGVFDDSQKAIDYSYLLNGKVAVKADGLAAGKGVSFAAQSRRQRKQSNQYLTRKRLARRERRSWSKKDWRDESVRS